MMKSIFFIMLLLTAISCKNNKEKSQDINEATSESTALVIDSIAANSGENGNYTYFIPDTNHVYPLMIFLDPHGDGNFILKKYVQLARQYKVIMIASNDAKNGTTFEQTTAIVDHLITESQRLKVKSDQISVVGFSGGAKAAIVAAVANNAVSQVVYCGAAFPPGTLQLNKPSIGIAGKADMNYTEVVGFYEGLASTGSANATGSAYATGSANSTGSANATSSADLVAAAANVKVIIYWNGKHEWPNEYVMKDVFILSARNEKNNLSELKNDLQIRIKNNKNIIEKAELINELAFAVRGTNEAEQLMKEHKYILASGEYKNAVARFRKEIEFEETQKNQINNAFQQMDMNWISNKIENLNKSTSPQDKRLLAYFSLASYSFSNRALQMNDTALADRMLYIYKLADPDNNEQIFMHAKLFARKNAIDSARYYKMKAIEKGYDPGKAASDSDIGGL